MALEIKLKLLSGGNVILANCLGYESELFVPVIINNRIFLQNAVVSRRCCNRDSITLGNSLQNSNLNILIKKSASTQNLPLANSTPTYIFKSNKVESSSKGSFSCSNRKNSIAKDYSRVETATETIVKPFIKSNENIANIISDNSENMLPSTDFTSSMIHRLPSPDIVRRAPVQIYDNSLPIHPQVTSIKVIRLHRANTPDTPKNLAKIIRTKTPLAKTSNPRILRNLSNLSSFGTPPSLNQTRESNSIECASPNQSFLNRGIKAPNTATKWRKCITPKRTYIRQRKGQKSSPKITSLQLMSSLKNDTSMNHYRLPKKSTSNVIIKRRLIIDYHKKITPRKFKKQLTNTEDLNRNEFELPKSRRLFNISQMTAFDLLTNSGFYPKIGRKLNSLFRQGCLNKHSDTILKYQQLTQDIPLLEEWK